MKMLTMLLLASVSSTPSSKELRLCDNITTLSETVMIARQEGIPMSYFVDLVSGYSEETRTLVLDVVKDAYDRPRWHTDERKFREVEDFRDQVYNECFDWVSE